MKRRRNWLNPTQGESLRMQIFFHAILGIFMLFVLEYFLISRQIYPQLVGEADDTYGQVVLTQAQLLSARFQSAEDMLTLAQQAEQNGQGASVLFAALENSAFAFAQYTDEGGLVSLADGGRMAAAEADLQAAMQEGSAGTLFCTAPSSILFWKKGSADKAWVCILQTEPLMGEIDREKYHFTAWVIDQENEILFTLENQYQAAAPDFSLPDLQAGQVITRQGSTVSLQKIAGSDLSLCVAVESEPLYRSTKRLGEEIWAVWAMLIIGALIFAFCFAFKVDVPINQLTLAMQHLDPTEDKPIEVHTQVKEIVRLTESFNQMKQHIHILLRQIVVEQQAKQQAEFRVLQAQINPHFLYNTLDTIAWKAMDYGAGEIADIISALSTFFRISLSDGRDCIRWDEEAEHVHSYLFIQQVRYEDKLDFNLYLDRELKDCMTIKLLLQPLVENALYHGIKQKEGRGRIDVSIVSEGADRVRVTVSDDGVGMSEKRLSELRSMLAHGIGRGGFGLHSIVQRLRIAYSEAFSFAIDSVEGQGTRIEIIMPQIEEEESSYDKLDHRRR